MSKNYNYISAVLMLVYILIFHCLICQQKLWFSILKAEKEDWAQRALLSCHPKGWRPLSKTITTEKNVFSRCTSPPSHHHRHTRTHTHLHTKSRVIIQTRTNTCLSSMPMCARNAATLLGDPNRLACPLFPGKVPCPNSLL